MIDPAKVALYIPPGLKDFKLNLFNRIGAAIEQKGGRIVRQEWKRLLHLPEDVVPIVGCQPETRPLIAQWKASSRPYIYWDRGYARRVFATWLPRGQNGGYYRWQTNAFQMRAIRDLSGDRWAALNTEVLPWAKGGRHIVIAAPTKTYSAFHGIESWTDDTIDALARVTNRQLVIRGKESKRPLSEDLKGAHAIVAHGSNAAVEAVIMGCPAVVHESSAAALVGLTDLKKIESPVYPDRTKWLHSLAYGQFDERELVDGTLWRLIV